MHTHSQAACTVHVTWPNLTPAQTGLMQEPWMARGSLQTTHSQKHTPHSTFLYCAGSVHSSCSHPHMPRAAAALRDMLTCLLRTTPQPTAGWKSDGRHALCHDLSHKARAPQPLQTRQPAVSMPAAVWKPLPNMQPPTAAAPTALKRAGVRGFLQGLCLSAGEVTTRDREPLFKPPKPQPGWMDDSAGV
jgi:hypothetical protein